MQGTMSCMKKSENFLEVGAVKFVEHKGGLETTKFRCSKTKNWISVTTVLCHVLAERYFKNTLI
jgi:hypothetical protein